MSRLIAKDGKLCIVSGRLVTDEGGAPCVCGDDVPTLQCDQGQIPLNPCIVITFEGLTGTSCPVQFERSREGVVTALDYNGTISVNNVGNHFGLIDSPQLLNFGSHSISCVFPGSGDGLPCDTTCGTSGSSSGLSSLFASFRCRPDGTIGLLALQARAQGIESTCGFRRESSILVFAWQAQGVGSSPLNTQVPNQANQGCFSYNGFDANNNPDTYPICINGTATVNVIAGPCVLGESMTDGDRMLAAMGFDPEEERRKLLNGGDCGCSPQAGFYT